MYLGDLTITSTLNTANFDINLKGNWSNSNIFDEGTGEVILSGTGDQNISNPVGETFYDLKLDKPSGVMTMDNDLRVSNALTMLQGNIITGSNTLILGTGTGNPGSLAHTAGTLVGSMERWINSTGTAILYPVGDDSWYRPAEITFTDLNGGSLVGNLWRPHPVARDCRWMTMDSRSAIHLLKGTGP